jgi:hypothetical protein
VPRILLILTALLLAAPGARAADKGNRKLRISLNGSMTGKVLVDTRDKWRIDASDVKSISAFRDGRFLVKTKAGRTVASSRLAVASDDHPITPIDLGTHIFTRPRADAEREVSQWFQETTDRLVRFRGRNPITEHFARHGTPVVGTRASAEAYARMRDDVFLDQLFPDQPVSGEFDPPGKRPHHIEGKKTVRLPIAPFKDGRIMAAHHTFGVPLSLGEVDLQGHSLHAIDAHSDGTFTVWHRGWTGELQSNRVDNLRFVSGPYAHPFTLHSSWFDIGQPEADRQLPGMLAGWVQQVAR